MKRAYQNLILIFQEYENKYPYLSRPKLAKIIYKEAKPFYFVKDIKKYFTEQSLRKYVDNYLNDKNNGINTKTNLDFEEFDIDIPEPTYKPKPIYKLPNIHNRILYIADIHIPFHDIQPIRTALKFGWNNGVNTIILNGDIIDMYGASEFVRNPKMRKIKTELDIAREFLYNLKNKFHNCKIIYKEGNHEERLKFMQWNKVPELDEIEGLTLKDILKLNELGIEFIEDRQIIKAGKLFVIHGHEIKTFGSLINVARFYRLKAFENILTAHRHLSQNDIVRTIGGKEIGGWSIGCLCNPHPFYAPINNWLHGFAFQTIEEDGNFEIQNKVIISGMVK